MADKQQALKDILGRLLSKPGAVGATLVTRDGICVHNADTRISAPETLSAMSAALLGAAETALIELGGPDGTRVIAESKGHRLLALGATDELLLVLVRDAKLPLADLVKDGEGAAMEIRRVVSGG